MVRNTAFASNRLPFRDDDVLSLESATGPLSWLNPTEAHFIHSGHSKDDVPSSLDENQAQNANSFGHVKRQWRSRDNRKGRHQIVIEVSGKGQKPQASLPPRTSRPSIVANNILRMLTNYPIWDISWCVAYIFTWGSIVWCINGFFSFLPLIRPSSEFPNEIVTGGGLTAFIGAVVFFEFGSILLMLEAVNENETGCFGWALEELVEDKESEYSYRLRPSESRCVHHHKNKGNFVGKGSESATSDTSPANEKPKDGKSWQWFPSRKALKEHYFHELGFLACFAQLLGATIFSIAGFTSLPGINNKMSQGLLDGIYWVPQVVGGSGFIVSGTLFMLETQKNWYTPAFDVLGWHIAFWNLVGGIGFTLCGALGLAYLNSGAQYQASCSTFWGSFAFLIGSLLQLYESLSKNPVQEVIQKQEVKLS